MDTSKATPDLYAAIALAQAEVENATKNSANPHFKSKYADLAEVLNTVRPVFAKHDLSILQSTEFDGSMVSVTTLIAHKGGGEIRSTASCVPAKSDGQGVGSSTTYLRRYSLAAMTGVAQEDDDGQSAVHDGKPAPLGAKDEAAARDWIEQIDAITTVKGLDDLAGEIAKSSLSASAKLKVRAAFAARKHTLKAA